MTSGLAGVQGLGRNTIQKTGEKSMWTGVSDWTKDMKTAVCRVNAYQKGTSAEEDTEVDMVAYSVTVSLFP